MDKTNVMRILDSKKIPYKPYEYDASCTEGSKIADILGEDHSSVFKTLVTETPTHNHYVFVIPVDETLDLKAAAKSVGEKSVSMLKQKELFSLTGYIHGGCSPIGMKKQFKTVIDASACGKSTFYISAGKVGRQIEVSPETAAELINAIFSDITVK